MSLNGSAEGRKVLRGSVYVPDAIHGKSAYEIAVMHGFDGTEEEWLGSLKSDFVTPEMFGAVGDGVTDDTEAIQKAINTKIPVWLSNKTYYVTAKHSVTNANEMTVSYALNIFDGTALIGHKTKIKAEAGVIYASNINGVEIDGVDFSSLNTITSRPLINIDNSFDVEISNCAFSDYVGDGIVFYGCERIALRKILMKDFTGHGVCFGRVNDLRCGKSTIDDVQVVNQHAYATSDSANPLILTCYETIVRNIRCLNCAWGIKLQLNSHDVTFENITFVGGENSTDNTGLKIQGSENYRISDVYVTNCQCIDNATDGYSLHITYADNVKVCNSEFQRCAYGVRLVDSDATFSNIRMLEVQTGFYCGDESPARVDGCYIKNATNFQLFSVDSKLVSLKNIVAEYTDDVSARMISSRNANAIVTVDGVKINSLKSSTFQIASPCLITNVSYSEQNLFVITLTSGTKTDLTTPLSIITSNSMCNVKTVGRLVDQDTNAALNGGIKGFACTNNRVRVYHDANEATRTIVIGLCDICVTPL